MGTLLTIHTEVESLPGQLVGFVANRVSLLLSRGTLLWGEPSCLGGNVHGCGALHVFWSSNMNEVFHA
jgi:hypothetical protein